MAKKKTENAMQQSDGVKIQKLFLMAKMPDGSIIPMDFSLPLAETSKMAIILKIDDGAFVKEIKEEEHQALIKASEDERKSWPGPEEKDHAAIIKLVDWFAPIYKEINLTEFVKNEFSPEDYKSLGNELEQNRSEKERIETDLKAYKESQKARITEIDASIKRITSELAKGFRTESVKHKWVMNDPKRNVKSLYRLDKDPMQLVRTAPMLPSDKQTTLEDYAASQQTKERNVEEKPVSGINNEPYDNDLLSDSEVESEIGEE